MNGMKSMTEKKENRKLQTKGMKIEEYIKKREYETV
jgi:hypothetical protein